jgi:CubicO group peptidase (beta-lactamase class C family)
LNGQHIHINPAAELVIVKLSSHPIGDTGFTHDIDRKAFAAIAEAVSK